MVEIKGGERGRLIAMIDSGCNMEKVRKIFPKMPQRIIDQFFREYGLYRAGVVFGVKTIPYYETEDEMLNLPTYNLKDLKGEELDCAQNFE